MYVVDDAPRDLIPIELPHGGKLFFRPWASGAAVAGQLAMQRALADGAEDPDANVAFTAGVASWAAVRWEGVGDAKGVELQLSKAMVELMVTQDPKVFQQVDRLYVLPGLALDAEKNGSALSLAGAGPAGAPTTRSARPGAAATSAPRARRPAKPARKP